MSMKDIKSMEKVSIEQFKTWFPKNPDAVLQDFLASGNAMMAVVFSGSGKTFDLSQGDATRLLEEFRFAKEGE